VKMRDVIVTTYRGQIGRVVAVKRAERGKKTLDKYTVRFADGQIIVAWGIQLERAKQSDVAA